MMEKEYYVGKDGNKPLKKPYRTKATTIHRNANYIGFGKKAGTFIPSWDSTDHLQFVCEECFCVADILEVRFSRSYSKETGSAIFFYLGCPVCGAVGQRKTYLKMRDDICKFQEAYTNNKVLLYAEKRTPHTIIKLEPKETIRVWKHDQNPNP